MSVRLASASPQRSALLRQLQIPFTVTVPEVEELAVGEANSVAARNSARKAAAVAARASRGEIVLAVDTVVEVDGQLFGKPASQQQAEQMLRALRAHTHRVTSGLTLVTDGATHTVSACTEVTFRDFGDQELARYLASGEWRERAGGYAIQGSGAALVAAIDGDYSNVVGLPIPTMLDLMAELGVLERAYATP